MPYARVRLGCARDVAATSMALLQSSDTTALALAAAAAIVGLIVAAPPKPVVRAVFVACVVAGVWIVLSRAEASRVLGQEDAALLLERASPPSGERVVLRAYHVRRATAGARAIGLHADVEEALAALLREKDVGSRGTLQVAVAAVEDFFQLYHATLMAPADSFQARQDVPTLLDARRDALNALHALENGVSHSRVGPIRQAVQVVRAACARCLRVLSNKHSGALRGVVMRAPYAAIDALSDARLVD